MPDRLVRSPVAWSAVLLALLYWALATILPVGFMVQILNGVFVGMSASLFVTFWRLGWTTLRLSKLEYRREDQFAIGMELIWIGLFLNRCYAIALRVGGSINGFTDNHWVGIFVYFWIIGGCLQVTSPGLYEGLTVGREKWVLYITMTLGALVAALLVAAQSWGSGTFHLPFWTR